MNTFSHWNRIKKIDTNFNNSNKISHINNQKKK